MSAGLTRSWRKVAELLVFMTTSVAGVFNASWLWVAFGALALFLLGYARWRVTIARAGSVDVGYHELGRLAFAARLFGIGFDPDARSHNVALVLAAKFSVDALFLAGAYLMGRAAGWMFAIDA
jgi:hypothetical protein